MTPSFTCPRCSRISHNPTDVAEGYCGHCHDWTGFPFGLWDDDDGTLHISVEDVLRARGVPVTPGTVAEAERYIMSAMAEQLPGIPVDFESS